MTRLARGRGLRRLAEPAQGRSLAAHAQNLRTYARSAPRPAPGVPALRGAPVPPTLPRMAAAQGRLSDDADGLTTRTARSEMRCDVPLAVPAGGRRAAGGTAAAGDRDRPDAAAPAARPARVRPGGRGRRRRGGSGRRPARPAARPGRARRLAGHLPAGDAGAGGAGAGDGGGPAAAGGVLVVADRARWRRAGCRTGSRAGRSPGRARTTSAGSRTRPAGDADRDPGVVDAARGAGRRAGHRGAPGRVVRSARARSRGCRRPAVRRTRHGRGDAAAAARSAAPAERATSVRPSRIRDRLRDTVVSRPADGLRRYGTRPRID